jgi:hypothetical protein
MQAITALDRFVEVRRTGYLVLKGFDSRQNYSNFTYHTDSNTNRHCTHVNLIETTLAERVYLYGTLQGDRL